MEQEIQDIIAKNLPAQVGDTLKLRLLQADTLEARVKELERDYTVQAQMIKDLRRENDQLHKDLSTHTDISLREETVSKRERAMDVFEAKLKAEEAEKRATELHGIVQTVFKSPVYRRNYYSGTHYDGQGKNIPIIHGSDETID